VNGFDKLIGHKVKPRFKPQRLHVITSLADILNATANFTDRLTFRDPEFSNQTEFLTN
jgi:hypothetical protein